ncbi:putative ORFan [Tupanvirus deep ocean]|uniref:ORFan n=2 Tax=Tupanvirus TaxID=2094720 RepID=A0AC62A7E3_9VIRU|nr:putative ORFan [Tupanvirus deep ocean]QKU33600.1 putative ORFan [Tupanvirus deep ocean]
MTSNNNVLENTTMKNSNCVIELFRNLFGINTKQATKKEITHVQSTEPTVESFEILDCDRKYDDKNLLTIINNNINQQLLYDINKLLEKAYHIDKTGIEKVECCVCYEENIDMTCLECAHPLCVSCYNKLIDKKFHNCPLCINPMKIVTVHKLYSIITEIDYACMGILYMPPIYVEEENKWIDHEVFYDIGINNIETTNFIKSCKRINTEGYVVVMAKPNIKKMLQKLPCTEPKKLKVIVV